MKALRTWHEIIEQNQPARLTEVVADNCVFFSPVVHTPQRGGELTRLYLAAAMQVFNENFRYTRKIIGEQVAVLEFECEIDGIMVNGVDLMTFDDDGKICEFKVMVRPLKAVNLLHARMRQMLEQLSA